MLRAIALEIPTLASLGLPNTLAKLTNHHQGLVLLTGPAGCGKSSTLAALVRLINEERQDHIVTVEDPIEYLHTPLRCVVNQRQVGRDTRSFARALKAALREDPDVIAIGELRDLETISLALTAAETGHLVLATLHTSSAIRTVDRVVGSYPSNQQAQIRTMLSESLRAVVSQRLVRRADGQGRVAALEILLGTRPVANLIRESKTFQLRSVLQTGATQGMCLLDTCARPSRPRGGGDARRGADARRRPEAPAGRRRRHAPRHPRHPPVTGPEGERMGRLQDLLRATRESGSSDLHLASGFAPRVRLHGSLVALAGGSDLTPEELADAPRRGGERRAVAGVSRFGRPRLRLRRPRGGALPRQLPAPGARPLRRLPHHPGDDRVDRGARTAAGARPAGGAPQRAGAGHRTDRLRQVDDPRGDHRPDQPQPLARHIVTIEEPVEFVHQNRRSVFSQREVGSDTVSFAAALRSAIRQDADVVLVGEMRDLETISLALKAAEMGMLVFGTLHTNSAAKTIDRLIDVFPADEQPQARLSLADSLAAIVAQLLLPRASGEGRVAVHEILLKTPALPNLIRESSIAMLVNLMQSGRSEGMQLLDDALLDLVTKKIVTPRDAYMKAQEKGRFEALIEKD